MVATTRSTYTDRKKWTARSNALMKAVDTKVSPFKGTKWPMQRLEKQLDEARLCGHARAKYLRAARHQWLISQRQQACVRPRKRGHFRMADLPGEIRNRIWEHAVFAGDEEFFFNALECPKLATVSKQVCQEVMPIFFKMNDFHIIFQKPLGRTTYGMEIHPHTRAWQKTVRLAAFPDLDYKEFLTEVVKLRHFSFTFLDDVKGLSLPTYAEWRVDYDNILYLQQNEQTLARRSTTRLLRSSAILRHYRFEPLYSTIRNELIALQVSRNRIAHQWFSAQKLKQQCHNGVPAFPFLVILAQCGPEKFLNFEQLYLTRQAEAAGKKGPGCISVTPGSILTRYFMRLLGLHDL